MRAATGGLAASDRMIPASISAISAASIGLSTVHHQSANVVRWARETIGGPPERWCGGGWCRGDYGCRGVKEKLRIRFMLSSALPETTPSPRSPGGLDHGVAAPPR